VHLLLARAAVAADRWSFARARIALARQAVAGSTPAIDALAAEVELGCGALDDAVDLAERALAGVPEAERAVRCEALEVLGRVTRLRDVGRAQEVFGRQLAVAEEGALAVWQLRALHQLGTLDLLAGPVLDGMRRARAVAVDQGALAVAADIDLQVAANLGGGFRVDECLELAQRCAELARRWRLGTVLPAARVVAAYAHGLAGRRAEMERLLAETLAGDVDDDLRATIRGRCRGLLALLDEDHPRALRELDAAMELVRGLRSPTLRPWFGVWAVLRTVHDRAGAQARAEARRLTPAGARPVEALLNLAEAVSRGRAGDRAAATELAAAADAALVPVAECVAGYHQLARRLVAEAALADGWGEPVRWLSEAAVFFADHAHHPAARACRQLLRRAGKPLPRRAATIGPMPEALRRLGITEREHDVLRLVAAGRTSGQIADELVISRRTVDKHVERILAKTGARRRADLRGLLPRSGT
jgi:DNA-binding CsgD family transcriptional regulator